MSLPSSRTDASCSYTRPIRPLPSLPLHLDRHALGRSMTDSELAIRLRPLPSPPSQSPTSTHTPDPLPPHISITPPTPLPAPTSSCRPERPRLSALQTSPAALLPAVKEGKADTDPSPLTPSIPQAPTPTTARRRRISKIRRHLGAGVPSELFLPQTRADKLQPKTDAEMFDSESESDEEMEWSASQAAAPVFRFVEKDDESSPWAAITSYTSYNPATQRRSTLKKWVWEKDGRRWDEKNYDEILDRLRKL